MDDKADSIVRLLEASRRHRAEELTKLRDEAIENCRLYSKEGNSIGESYQRGRWNAFDEAIRW